MEEKNKDYISQYQYIAKNILEYNNKSILQKLPMLIRNDGLEKTLLYLENKDFCLYNVIISYIRKKYDIDIGKSEERKKCKNNDIIKYIRLKKEIYHLAIKFINLSGCLRENSCKKKLDKKRNKFKNKIDDKNYLNKEEKKKRLGYLNSKFFNAKSNIVHQKIYKDFALIEANTNKNLVVGLGEVSVKEVSMKKHHLLDIPYIPASSIKGIFHQYCLEIKKELGEDRITKWFGTEEKQGGLIFLDAYPKLKEDESYELKKDIMTPHYQQYYSDESNKKMPKDDDTPKPIKFDIICNTTFQFIVYIKENTIEREKVERYFKECINFKSFGAKTSIGYGQLEVVDERKKCR